MVNNVFFTNVWAKRETAKHTIHIYMAKQTPAEIAAALNEKMQAETSKLEAENAIIKAEHEAAEAAKKAAEKPKPTSPKLVELEAARKAKRLEARQFEPDSEAETKCLDEAYKISLDIKAEIANIAKIESDAILQLKRSERIALNNAQFVALFGSDEAFEAFKNSLAVEQLDKFKAANEIVSNELLSKFAATPKANKAESNGTAKTSDAEMLALATANYQAGMLDADNRKALEAAGSPRSSAWHTLNNYQLANNLPKRK